VVPQKKQELGDQFAQKGKNREGEAPVAGCRRRTELKGLTKKNREVSRHIHCEKKRRGRGAAGEVGSRRCWGGCCSQAQKMDLRYGDHKGKARRDYGGYDAFGVLGCKKYTRRGWGNEY